MTKYPVQLTPPAITAYRDGGTAIDYVTTFDIGRPGPHVMVSAVTHGNELCGAIVLDFLFREKVRPSAGKLTLAFVNYRAYLTFDARYPGARAIVLRRNYPYRGVSDALVTHLRRRYGARGYAGMELEVNQKHVESPSWRALVTVLATTLGAAIEQI